KYEPDLSHVLKPKEVQIKKNLQYVERPVNSSSGEKAMIKTVKMSKSDQGTRTSTVLKETLTVLCVKELQHGWETETSTELKFNFNCVEADSKNVDGFPKWVWKGKTLGKRWLVISKRLKSKIIIK
ncbi:hypothetical protein ACLOJK_006912, partial [Asimina triloba]